ncbi:MAG: ATP-binding protein, partial [Bacteroidota bacterium]
KLQIAQEKAQELIQEKEALIEQLKQTQIQLIQKEKMASLGQLSAGIAHEINNPANFVSGNAEALNMDLQEIKSVLDLLAQLKKEGQSSKLIASLLEANEKLDMDFLQKEILQLSESIQRGSSRIQNIVGSLKSFSHSSGEEFQDAQLNELIDSTLTILTHKLKLKETELEKEYAELPEILCQPGKISQVCMNLLDNAIDAIDRHGKISIKSWQEGEDVFLRIQDDGSGIDEATRSKIFDPFFTTKEIGEGSGLGLSISYGIVKDHGGSIELESSPEAGSSFLIRLPLGGT